MSDLVCLGELIVDFVSRDASDGLENAETFARAAGGAPANVAAGCAKYGVKTEYIGKAGNDFLGRHMRATLARRGIGVSGVTLDPALRTTMSFISPRPDGIRDTEFMRGADAELRIDEVPTALLDGAAAFHFGGVTLSVEPARSATLYAAREARRRGLFVSYDPNFRGGMWKSEDIRPVNDEAFALADLVKISLEESPILTGEATPERAAEYVRSRGAGIVIVTLAENGCYYDDGVRSGYVSGFATVPVDSTGAGDAFTAAVVSYIVRERLAGREIALDDAFIDRLRFANAAGAIVVGRFGGIPAMPDEDEVNGRLTQK